MNIKRPRYAKLRIRNNICYPVVLIHFETNQVTLRENEKVFNTVNINDVEFDFSDLSNEEKVEFCKYLEKTMFK